MLAIIPLVIVLLVATNALYVAAEFAAVSVRKSRVRQLAMEGDRLAKLFLPVVEDRVQLDRYIAACQIGITFSSLVLGAYGQATLPPRLAPMLEDLGAFGPVAAQSISAIVILCALTATQVVIGELVPKSIALQYPTRVSLLTAVPMRWSLTALRPFIWILNGSGLALLKLMRAPQTSHGHIHSPAEIELLIVQSEVGGQLSREERRRLRRALRLGTRAAHDVMIPRPRILALDAADPIEELTAAAAASPYTRLPVFQGSIDNIVGVLHTKQLVIARMSGETPNSVMDMVQPPMVVAETSTVDRLLSAMREQGSAMAVVVDEFGGTAGIVTLEDILAELFGEFGDEFKAGQPEPLQLPEGGFRFPGLLPTDDVPAYIGEAWDGTADTVGGHVTDVLGRIPGAGDHVAIGSYEVFVERVEHHAVQSVRLVPLRASEEAHD